MESISHRLFYINFVVKLKYTTNEEHIVKKFVALSACLILMANNLVVQGASNGEAGAVTQGNDMKSMLNLSYGSEPEQIGDLYIPKKVTADTPKILLIHGGGWVSEKYLKWTLTDQSAVFCNDGYVVYNIDYRLAPKGEWPLIGDDCITAAKKLISCEGIPELAEVAGKPISVLGVSAGGHLSLMTGLCLPRKDVMGVISISGIADHVLDAEQHPGRYEQLFNGKPIDVNAFPPAHIKDDMPAILLTHFWDDDVVPIESQIVFARALADRGSGIETYFYDFDRRNQGHGIWDVNNKKKHVLYSDIYGRISAFLNKVYGKPQPLPGGASFKYLGKLDKVTSSEIKESSVSIGFECLDRDLFVPEYCYDKLAAIGVKNARVQTGWWKCEKEKGVYDWTWLDNIVENLERRGIKPWFNVGFGNKLYMGETYGDASVGFVPIHYGEECEKAWVNFCRALAERYKGRIDYYEIWNEANGKSFWRPKEPNSEGYAKLIKITADAIHEANPDARCGACVAGFPKPYILDLKRYGAMEKLNFFALHPYDPQPEQSWPQRVQWLRDALAGAGYRGSDIEVWQGESGFASWTPEKYWQARFVRESERAQAVWLLRRFILDLHLDLQMSSYFQTVDMMEKAYQMGNSEQGTRKVARQGILNGLTYTPKPSYFALSSVAAIFHDGVKPVSGDRFIAWQDDARPMTKRHDRLENVAVRCLTFARGRTPYYVYYMPADPQFGWADSKARTTLEFFNYKDLDLLKKPVLINLLTGDVFELPTRGNQKDFGSVFIDNLPLSDTPMIICDRSVISITN